MHVLMWIQKFLICAQASDFLIALILGRNNNIHLQLVVVFDALNYGKICLLSTLSTEDKRNVRNKIKINKQSLCLQ